ncbi:MAG: permease prefix domain 1-containing protein [Acidimicrobiia bacterium]
MNSLETQIGEWRTYVSRARSLNGRDVDELEGHLRDQIADLHEVGLDEDEAFLVAVKRMGGVDELSHEFAREHSERLWKQLVLADVAEPVSGRKGLAETLLFAGLAAAAVQAPRLLALLPGNPDVIPFLVRNTFWVVLLFLAWYYVRRNHLTRRQALVTTIPFAISAALVNLYPWESEDGTQILALLHLPVALWFVVGYSYMGGTWALHGRRMDFVRFTGEWFIYYVLIALGGGVLVALTSLILEPISVWFAQKLLEWVLLSGAAGAVIVAAWLVEAKRGVVENMAPVLTNLFTPLFAVMLAGSAATYALTSLGGDFDRELLTVFDALLVVVLGLVLYGMSARDPEQPPGLLDRILLVAIVGALALDLMVLGSMAIRIGELGFTPNRVAAIGLNLVLLVNLVGAAWLSGRFVSGRATFPIQERWQTTYLPVLGLWAAAVVVVLPPLFSFG